MFDCICCLTSAGEMASLLKGHCVCSFVCLCLLSPFVPDLYMRRCWSNDPLRAMDKKENVRGEKQVCKASSCDFLLSVYGTVHSTYMVVKSSRGISVAPLPMNSMS